MNFRIGRDNYTFKFHHKLSKRVSTCVLLKNKKYVSDDIFVSDDKNLSRESARKATMSKVMASLDRSIRKKIWNKYNTEFTLKPRW